MHTKNSSVGRLIDRLERDGLIERKRSINDRRLIYLYLTEKGDKLITDLIPIGIKFNEDLIRGIDDKELMIYEKVLEKMLSNIKK